MLCVVGFRLEQSIFGAFYCYRVVSRHFPREISVDSMESKVSVFGL